MKIKEWYRNAYFKLINPFDHVHDIIEKILELSWLSKDKMSILMLAMKAEATFLSNIIISIRETVQSYKYIFISQQWNYGSFLYIYV